MIRSLPSPVADPVSGAELGSQCRVFERHACGLPSRCQPASSFGREDLKWSGTIEDISKGGVCLNLDRRFEKGTGLAIELPSADDRGSYTVLAKVVQVRRNDAGGWALGCQFVSALGDDEVERLLPKEHSGDDSAIVQAAPVALPVSAPIVAPVAIGSVVGAPILAAPVVAVPMGIATKERRCIPSVRLMVEISPQTTIGCKVADFGAATGRWPIAAGTTGTLKGDDGAGNSWKLKVKVRSCQSGDEGWNVNCQLVGRPTRPELLRALAGLVLKN